MCIRDREYIEANYNSDLTLKNLSKIFHYNVAYFGKLFKSNTGMSYNDYVTSVRMEKAKELLNQGEKVYNCLLYTSALVLGISDCRCGQRYEGCGIDLCDRRG